MNNFSDKDLLLNAKEDPDSFTHEEPEMKADFENRVDDIQNRYKAKTTAVTKSALHVPVKTQNQQLVTRSEVFRGDHEYATVMAKYTVFWANKRENSKLYKLVVELPHLETVMEAIRDIIPYFNQRLAEENSNYSLSTDPTLYEFFKAKKSGLPKTDYPALDANQVLSQTGIQNICLAETSLRAVIQKSMGIPYESSKSKKASMLTPSMPGDSKSNQSSNASAHETYVEETFCFCFTKKKKINKDSQNGLNENLMDGF